VDPLELASRRAIYEYVRDHPGAYVREIMAALGMPQGQASYHLDTLEARGLVSATKEQYHKRYFVPGTVPRGQRNLARFLKARVPRSVLLALLEEPDLQHRALAEKAGVRPPTLTYHMKRLEAEGLVVRAREGGEVRYRVADEAALVDALVTYRRSLMDAAVDRFLASWGEMHPGHLQAPAEQGAGGQDPSQRGGTDPKVER
jgi:predicted transcriptional regulator